MLHGSVAPADPSAEAVVAFGEFEDAEINRALRDSYGIPVYQEQALLLSDTPGAPEFPPFQDLAPKGHFIGRTMLAVEIMWYWRNTKKLK